MSQVREPGRGPRAVVLVAVFSMIVSLMSVLGGASPVSADPDPGTVTVVIGTASRPSRPDQAILDRLDATGHPYVVVDDSDLTAAMADAADFVLLTDSVLRGRVRGDIEATSTPVASMKWGLFRDLGFLERGGRAGRVGGGKSITINDPSHPLAAGLSGEVDVLTRNIAIGYANIGTEGTMVAERGMARRMRSTVFAYEEGETLSSGAVAPGRRIGTFIANAVVTRLNSNGWALFDAMIDYGLDGAVVNPNQPPTVEDQSFTIEEDVLAGDFVGKVDAFDPDTGDVLTFSLDDESDVEIDASTGDLTVAPTGSLVPGEDIVVTVTVADPDGLTDNATITIMVLNVNDPPDVEDQSFNVDETALAFDIIGTVVASDPDVGDTLSYALSDESDIAIDAATGELTVATTANLVGATEIVLTVTVTDTSGSSTDATVTVTVNDVNDPPVVTITAPSDGDSFT
ncbi:MAG: Ig-like domain-containing protein, partial [Acidimicrobiales bacterium]